MVIKEKCNHEMDVRGKSTDQTERLVMKYTITETLNIHESEQAPAESEGQGSLACCRPWGRRQSDRHDLVTEQQQQCCAPRLGKGEDSGVSGKLLCARGQDSMWLRSV